MRQRHFRAWLLLLWGTAVCAFFSPAARAQVATASINGTVSDASGAVVPGAVVVLHNVLTNVEQAASTNAAGNYAFVEVSPGRYTLRVSKEGFATATQNEFEVFVNQTSTHDIILSVGATTTNVTVEAVATSLEASTAELGTAVSTNEVNSLPLNGRNFTELLMLTPGVSPVDTGQSAGGGGGFIGNTIGTFAFPSVNGQSNRSNFFLLDGFNDEASFLSTVDVGPVIDQIQEFKVESHNDTADHGQAMGSVIDVVSKSGTNAFHGDAFEFLRNNVLDSRNSFLAKVVPFKQNQFGGTLGGPVILPGYNGHNRTFFFAAYEGFRDHSTSTGLYTTPTPAEYGGDLSAVSAQIYNPFSTRPDPAHPGDLMRDPFMCDASGTPEPVTNGIQAAGVACNKIPTSLLNQPLINYAQQIFPAPMQTSIPGINGIDTTPYVVRQDTVSLRFDEEINEKNTLWARYSGFSQPDTYSAGFPGVLNTLYYHGYQFGAKYTHTFGGNAVADIGFGRTTLQANADAETVKPQSLWPTGGFTPLFAADYAVGPLNPGLQIAGYLGWSDTLDEHHVTNTYQFKGNYSLIHGRHTIKAGADFQTNNGGGPFSQCWIDFGSSQTANPESASGTGNALASMLMSVPWGGSLRNTPITNHNGWIDGFYVQDQWKATTKLTVNIGFRYDITFNPIFGDTKTGNQFVDDLDLNNGTYILEKMPPACSATQGVPCIPGGTLPAHVVLTPYKNGQIMQNAYDNWQGRLGFAYRLGSKNVIRAAYGRFYDSWSGQLSTNQAWSGTWPSEGELLAADGTWNNPTPSNPTPNTFAQDPFHQGTTVLLPAPTPYNQVEWYINPYFPQPYSDQWNFGIERQLNAATLLSVNYVGSHSSHLDLGVYGNVSSTPGPGDPSLRRPYPYITPTYYDRSQGRSHYDAFQLSVHRTAAKGLTYLISYTWSKAMDIGCSGMYATEGCSVQNPYDLDADKSVSGFDLTHIFSGSAVYQLPFGSGQKFASGSRALNDVIGNWQLNGIVRLTSGTPYNVNGDPSIPNTGNSFERADLVGNPKLSSPTTAEWINTAAFTEPAPFTFGNLGRNALRSDWFRDFDLSLFRDFRFTESKALEFRAEFFNAFNNVVWGTPDSTLSDPNFGKILSMGNTPRQIQFALKFMF